MNKKKKVKAWGTFSPRGKLDQVFSTKVAAGTWQLILSNGGCGDYTVERVEITFPAPKKNLEKRNKK